LTVPFRKNLEFYMIAQSQSKNKRCSQLEFPSLHFSHGFVAQCTDWISLFVRGAK
jgi:hypothetical protein